MSVLPSNVSLGAGHCVRPVHEPGHSYVQSLGRDDRRLDGVVYTPSLLVRFILELARFPLDQRHGALLDPACGAGAFLVEAVRSWLKAHPQPSIDRALSELKGRFFGLDKDPIACQLARDALDMEVRHWFPDAPPGSLSGNVLQADYLEGEEAPQLAGQVGGFSFIVGNPPYVATDRLSNEKKQTWRERFLSANGRIDLYMLFLERSLSLLRSDGCLAFITPNKYLTSESARNLRRLLLETGRLETIAQFRSHRIFSGAATVPCVTVFRKSPRTADLELIECGEQQDGQSEIPVLARHRVPSPCQSEEPWHLLNPVSSALAARIRAGHQSLQAFSERISAGIATGRDRIFILPARQAEHLEPELWRPAVRGQDVHQFRVEDPNLRILIPYLPTLGRPHRVDLREFPRTCAYLESYRLELEERHCIRKWEKVWYDLHDPWTLDVALRTKVLVPDVANRNRFALDTGRFCPLHSTYYILPTGIDPVYLVAVLNSKPVEFLMRLHAPIVKDGFSRYRKQFMRSLPIPVAAPARMREVVAAVHKESWYEVDQLVGRLFELEPAEMKQIEAAVSQLSSTRFPCQTIPN